MKRTVRVTFDGEVLRPEQPLDLAPNERYQVTIEDVLHEEEVQSQSGPLAKYASYAQDVGEYKPTKPCESPHLPGRGEIDDGTASEHEPAGEVGRESAPALLQGSAATATNPGGADSTEQHHHVTVGEIAPADETSHEASEDDSRPLMRYLRLARSLGVTDLAEQHDHYLYGTPKR